MAIILCVKMFKEIPMASKGLIYVLGDNTIRVCGDAQVFSRLCLAFVHVCMSCWYCVRVGSRRVGSLNIFSLSAIVHYVISCWWVHRTLHCPVVLCSTHHAVKVDMGILTHGNAAWPDRATLHGMSWQCNMIHCEHFES